MKRVVVSLTVLVAIVVIFVVSIVIANGAQRSIPQVDEASKRGDAIFGQLDADHDGKLTKQEFLSLADRAPEKDRARKQLAQDFDKMDPSNRGITRGQFQRILNSRKMGVEK